MSPFFQECNDWNTVQLCNIGVDSRVLLEVAQSEPVARFESMADPRVPCFVKKVMQVVDTEEHVSINGLEGFRFDILLSGMGESEMSVGESSDKVQSLMRQYVLHDGVFQYYLAGIWPKGNTTQAATCQAIMEGVRGCPSLVA